MVVDVRVFLQSRGVIDANGTQTRPVSRSDVVEIIDQNGGSAENVFLPNLDFSGANLDGLDLSGAWFTNCKFENVHLTPLVKVFGNKLPPRDPNAGNILARWKKGQLADYEEVTEAKLVGTVFSNCKIIDSYFYYADMQERSSLSAVLGVSGFGQFWVREIGVKKLLV